MKALLTLLDRCGALATASLLVVLFNVHAVNAVLLPTGRLQQIPTTAESPIPRCLGIKLERPIVTEGDWIRMRANVYVPSCEFLTYSWVATGGNIVHGLAGDPTAVFDSSGLEPGDYQVTASVADLHGRWSGACTQSIRVVARVDPHPIALRAERSYIADLGSVRIWVDAANSTSGLKADELVWTTTSGRLVPDETGAWLYFEEFGVQLTVSARAADSTRQISGSIVITLVGSAVCGMPADIRLEFDRDRSAIDDAMQKVVLDDLAIRLKNLPELVLVLGGCAEEGERPGIARERAASATKYLLRKDRSLAARVVSRVFEPYAARDYPTKPRMSVVFVRGPVGANDCGPPERWPQINADQR